jgi:hypothetical protein
MQQPAIPALYLGGEEKLSSFSGSQRSCFCTSLPMLIRPITGGVMARPLIMLISFQSE